MVTPILFDMDGLPSIFKDSGVDDIIVGLTSIRVDDFTVEGTSISNGIFADEILVDVTPIWDGITADDINSRCDVRFRWHFADGFIADELLLDMTSIF